MDRHRRHHNPHRIRTRRSRRRRPHRLRLRRHGRYALTNVIARAHKIGLIGTCYYTNSMIQVDDRQQAETDNGMRFQLYMRPGFEDWVHVGADTLLHLLAGQGVNSSQVHVHAIAMPMGMP